MGMADRCACLALFIAPLCVLSAVPPLTEQDRSHRCTHELTGVVQKATSSQIEVAQGTDTLHYAGLVIEHVHQSSMDLLAGDEITVEYSRTASRPFGWVGPQGQNAVMKVGQRVRLWADSEFKLLNPNGFDVLVEPRAPPLRASRQDGLAGTVELTRDLRDGECPWLEPERKLVQGQRFRVFSGHTYGVISPSGVAVQDEGDDGPFFELPADALRRVRDGKDVF
jgi:hypothetical protein